MKRLFRQVFAEWGRNGSVALSAAEAASGLTREELAESLRERPRLHPLLTRLLFAAGMNGHDAVLRAMGTAVGNAVVDPLRVDECELILAALADLNAAHTQLLHLMTTQATVSPEGSEGGLFWTTETLVTEADFPDQVGSLVLAALISRGLAEIPAMVLGAPVRITALGSVVLDVLDEWEGADSGGRRGS
ncbi:hypothetical protein GCM10023328_02150 [Modestobacter marinus]|nr:hypothetical protein GCM10011589_07810 [Modestobacter marinus]